MQPFDYQKSVVEVNTLLREKGMSEEDIKLVLDAYAFANEKHYGVTRESGEPYIIHPYSVFKILFEEMCLLDAEAFAGGDLHDTVEDCGVEVEEIDEKFGPDVAFFVATLTDIHKLKFSSRMEADQFNFQKLLEESIKKRIVVLLIKLADRLHNLRTLGTKKGEYKQKHTAYETLMVYVPLAHWLGMETIAREMEEIAFGYLFPKKEKQIKQDLQSYILKREADVVKVNILVKDIIFDSGINAESSFRFESIPEISHSLDQHQKFDEIHNVKQIKILANTKEDCYSLLNLLKEALKESNFSIMPHKEKDFLDDPRPNLYQALHFSFTTPDGDPYQIQITTRELEQTNNLGIAYYKNSTAIQAVFEEKFGFFDKVLESGIFNLSGDGEALDERLLGDILKNLEDSNTIGIIDKNQLLFLPRGSIVYDLCYSYYRNDIACHIAGALVNGKEVECNHVLNNGDKVSLIYTPEEHAIDSNAICMTREAQKVIKLRCAS